MLVWTSTSLLMTFDRELVWFYFLFFISLSLVFFLYVSVFLDFCYLLRSMPLNARNDKKKHIFSTYDHPHPIL